MSDWKTKSIQNVKSADYKNMLIIEKKAKKGLDLSNNIAEILKEKFKT